MALWEILLVSICLGISSVTSLRCFVCSGDESHPCSDVGQLRRTHSLDCEFAFGELYKDVCYTATQTIGDRNVTVRSCGGFNYCESDIAKFTVYLSCETCHTDLCNKSSKSTWDLLLYILSIAAAIIAIEALC